MLPLFPSPQALRCSIVEGGVSCPNTTHARGLCCKHYKQADRRGELPPRTLSGLDIEYVKFAASADIAKQLRRTSRVTGKSMAQLVREAVDRYLKPDEIAR